MKRGCSTIAMTGLCLFIAVFLAFPNTLEAEAPLQGPSSTSNPSGTREAIVESHPVHPEQHVLAEDGDCRLQWIVYTSDVNRGVVKHRATCHQPLEGQIPLLSAILEKVLETEGDTGPFRTLFWGRLTPDVRQDRLEMSSRLAMAAHLSPDWDSEKGRSRKGHVNAFVVELANKAMIYRELEGLFARFNRKLEFSSAEKVLIAEAGTLPFFDQLGKNGVQASERLPFDCLTWFSISAVPGPE